MLLLLKYIQIPSVIGCFYIQTAAEASQPFEAVMEKRRAAVEQFSPLIEIEKYTYSVVYMVTKNHPCFHMLLYITWIQLFSFVLFCDIHRVNNIQHPPAGGIYSSLLITK